MTEIIQSTIENEVKNRFMEYASYVIGDRALPDIRDGLKPVQRRSLFSMYELGLKPTAKYKKSARAVGDTMGKFHPHGDTSIYEAMVVMSQGWKMRYPLVDMHGNNGSVDGDPAAAMRYTESRLSPVAYRMIDTIDEAIVNYVPNFDDSLTEPSILPSFFPNLLCNGTTGIAVAMATSIPPHHADAIYKALLHAVDAELAGEEVDIENLIKIVIAPDFPTGGTIINLTDVHKGYRTGKGRVMIRSKYEMIENAKGDSIVITEIPFRVVKSSLVVQIDNLRKEDLKNEIKEVRDESARGQMRIVIELKKGVNTDFVIKRLLKSTDMQASFSMNLVALHQGRPIQFTLKDAIEAFLAHVAEVITRRSERDSIKARKRLHLVDGIISILDVIDEVIEVIKSQKTSEDVTNALMTTFSLSEEQAEAIAKLRLRALAQASIQAYLEEKATLAAKIAQYTEILTDTTVLLNTMKTELIQAQEQFSDKRLTEIVIADMSSSDDRELIKEEDLIITISQNGLIKSVQADEYQAKGRGTKGVKASVKNDDAITHMFSVNSRDDLLFFTNTGRCHVLEVYKLPVLTKNQAGKYVSNYLNLDTEISESIISVIPREYQGEEQDIMMATAAGTIKRLSLSNLSSRGRQTRVIGFKEDDYLVSVELLKPEQHIVLLTATGKGLRINPDAETGGVRAMGRTAVGVRGIKLKEDDCIISMTAVETTKDLMLITDKGYGKRVAFDNIPSKGRGAQGVNMINLTDKTGVLSAVTTIDDEDDLMIATVSGIMSRINGDKIRAMGRAAAGVKIINLADDDEVVSISRQDREVIEDEPDESGE